MIFEEKIKETNFRPTDKITKVRLDLEPKRENNLQKITAYANEVAEHLGFRPRYGVSGRGCASALDGSGPFAFRA